MEVIVSDDLYWKLVKLGADFKQSPGEYVAKVVLGGFIPLKKPLEAL